METQEPAIDLFEKYVRRGHSEMRPYVEGESLEGISVSDTDTPEIGGMIARNPDNHEDQWYVARDYFEKNLEKASGMAAVQGGVKTLHNTDESPSTVNVPDIVRFGDPDQFRLICKASSHAEGWMKSTKAMEVVGGCVVQVTTQQRNPDGSYAVAEALTYVPGVRVASYKTCDESGGDVVSRKLVDMNGPDKVGIRSA